jgi:hypothetical protein
MNTMIQSSSVDHLSPSEAAAAARQQRSQSVPMAINETSPTAAAVLVPPMAMGIENNQYDDNVALTLLGGPVDDGTSSGVPMDTPPAALRVSMSLPLTAVAAPVTTTTSSTTGPGAGVGATNATNNNIGGGNSRGSGGPPLLMGSNGSGGSLVDRRSPVTSRTSSNASSLTLPPSDLKIDVRSLSPQSNSNGDDQGIAMTTVGTSASPTSSTTTTTTTTNTTNESKAITMTQIPIQSRTSSRSSASIEFSKEVVPSTRGTSMVSQLFF